MINNLPRWGLPDLHPSFYDTESATAIEMVAKLYGKMKELVDDYNKYVKELDEKITTHEDRVDKENEIFRVGMRQEFQDFIDIINLKLKGMTKDIEDSIQYISDHLEEYIVEVANNMVASGEIAINLLYDEDTEALNLVVVKSDGTPLYESGNGVEY